MTSQRGQAWVATSQRDRLTRTGLGNDFGAGRDDHFRGPISTLTVLQFFPGGKDTGTRLVVRRQMSAKPAEIKYQKKNMSAQQGQPAKLPTSQKAKSAGAQWQLQGGRGMR